MTLLAYPHPSAAPTAWPPSLAARLFELIGEAAVLTDRAGMIVEVNPAFERITGYSRDEALGRPVSMLSSGRHDRRFYVGMWSALREQGHWAGEICNRRRNGELFVARSRIVALDGGSSPRHYLGVFADISAERPVIACLLSGTARPAAHTSAAARPDPRPRC